MQASMPGGLGWRRKAQTGYGRDDDARPIAYRCGMEDLGEVPRDPMPDINPRTRWTTQQAATPSGQSSLGCCRDCFRRDTFFGIAHTDSTRG